MYKFIRTKDDKNEFDLSNVMMVIKSNECTLPEILDEFKRFLIACGFAINPEATIEIVEEEKQKEINGEN